MGILREMRNLRAGSFCGYLIYIQYSVIVTAGYLITTRSAPRKSRTAISKCDRSRTSTATKSLYNMIDFGESGYWDAVRLAQIYRSFTGVNCFERYPMYALYSLRPI